MRFLQDKKIKVSLFLQQSLQTQDGALVLSNEGLLPSISELPGCIKYFDRSAIVSTRHFELGDEGSVLNDQTYDSLLPW